MQSSDPQATGPPETLQSALLKAQQFIQGVAHDARNDFSNYDYTSSEAMIRAARTACLQCGLLIRRISWEYERRDEFGGEVSSTFEVAHPLSGTNETRVIPWPAIIGKGKPWDKAVATALTTAWSYWVRDLLAIPRAEDGDMNTRDDRDYAPRPQKKQDPVKADTEATIATIKKAPTALRLINGIAWLYQQNAEKKFTKPQFQKLLLESLLHGLDIAADDDEREELGAQAHKNKDDLGTVNYQKFLDAASAAHLKAREEIDATADNEAVPVTNEEPEE